MIKYNAKYNQSPYSILKETTWSNKTYIGTLQSGIVIRIYIVTVINMFISGKLSPE